jgi:ribonuclease E
MELSRQRRRTGVLEGSSHVCPVCQGAGRVRSVESSALKLLRAIDEEADGGNGDMVEARAPTDVALYVLNEKREALARIEDSRRVRVRVVGVTGLLSGEFELQSSGERSAEAAAEIARENARRAAEDAAQESAENSQVVDEDEEDSESEVEEARSEDGAPREEGATPAERAEGDGRRRRRRGRRGGRRREEGTPVHADGAHAEGGPMELQEPTEAMPEASGEAEDADAGGDVEAKAAPSPAEGGERTGRRRRRRRGGRGGRGGEREQHAPQTGESDGASALENYGDVTPASVGVEDDVEPEPEAPAYAALASFDPEPRPAPVAEPVHEPALEPTLEPVLAEPAHAAPSLVSADAFEYSPDQERREKFFARLSRWGKKEAG